METMTFSASAMFWPGWLPSQAVIAALILVPFDMSAHSLHLQYLWSSHLQSKFSGHTTKETLQPHSTSDSPPQGISQIEVSHLHLTKMEAAIKNSANQAALNLDKSWAWAIQSRWIADEEWCKYLRVYVRSAELSKLVCVAMTASKTCVTPCSQGALLIADCIDLRESCTKEIVCWSSTTELAVFIKNIRFSQR